MKHLFTSIVALALAAAASANSPYIHKVWEYQPAPGQFIHVYPEIGPDDNPVDRATEQICGNDVDGPRPGLISLGAFGGYVIFSFDHPVLNLPGQYDFIIYGNAIKSDRAANGGSSEPGIVMVSMDQNGDGIPNDPWYELAGSDYRKASTAHNYSITYHRPDPNRAVDADPDPDQKWLLDRTYIRWTDSENQTGYIQRTKSQTQSYWPTWTDAETLTFQGTRLAPNFENTGTDTNPYWLLHFLDWGYVDNLPNLNDDGLPNPEFPGFNIDWAVDADGNPVHLDQVDFIKVYTAVNQTVGQLGETSTEITGGEDLHPQANASIHSIEMSSQPTLSYRGNQLILNASQPMWVEIYNLQGVLVKGLTASPGASSDLSALASGIYIARAGSAILKIAVQ